MQTISVEIAKSRLSQSKQKERSSYLMADESYQYSVEIIPVIT